jgi:hypothetical protein
VITVAALVALVLLSMPMLRKRDRAARLDLARSAAAAQGARALTSARSGSSLPAPVAAGRGVGEGQRREPAGLYSAPGREDSPATEQNGHLGPDLDDWLSTTAADGPGRAAWQGGGAPEEAGDRLGGPGDSPVAGDSRMPDVQPAGEGSPRAGASPQAAAPIGRHGPPAWNPEDLPARSVIGAGPPPADPGFLRAADAPADYDQRALADQTRWQARALPESAPDRPAQTQRWSPGEAPGRPDE